jgi:hypothetical protein
MALVTTVATTPILGLLTAAFGIEEPTKSRRLGVARKRGMLEKIRIHED